MRQLILKRIEELKSFDGFSESLMRWQNVRVKRPHEVEQHISKVDFSLLRDDQLLDVFETILVRYYKQM